MRMMKGICSMISSPDKACEPLYPMSQKFQTYNFLEPKKKNKNRVVHVPNRPLIIANFPHSKNLIIFKSTKIAQKTEKRQTY